MLTDIGEAQTSSQLSAVSRQPAPVVAPDAPVTPADLIRVTGLKKQAIYQRIARGQWVSLVAGGHVYDLAVLPADWRARIERERNRAMDDCVTDQRAARAVALRSDKLPQDYTDRELTLGRARADFVLAVFAHKFAHPERSLRDSCREAALLAQADLTETFAPLRTRGLSGYSAIDHHSRSGSDYKFPAYSNFETWLRRWKPFHGEFRPDTLDHYQYWVLCDRNAERAEKLRGHYAREGDERFWEAYRQLYVSAAHSTEEEAYRDATALAVKNGWPDRPSLRQVKYFYQVKISEAERRAIIKVREGRKTHYDDWSIWIIRDWRRVQPDDCWSFDGHKLDLMVRVWDPVAQGWRADRPWLVNAIDSCSWFEMGRHFTLVPAQDSVEYVIAHALQRYGRAPQLFYFDNGKEFKAAGKKLVMDEGRLDEVSGNLNTEAMYALPYNPRAKVNERDYLNLVRWFECKQPTYLGNAAINKSNFDQRWADLHKPGAPLERDARGCLVNWQLVPTLEELAELYDHYRETDHHQRRRTGRICPNQSPAEKYLAAPVQRRVTPDEVALAFLRVIGPQTIEADGRVYYRPPGCRRGEEIYFQDEALLPFCGRRVVVKFDVAAMRAFAFEVLRDDDLRLIKCAGAFGSVPREELLHPFRATQEQIRGKKRTWSKWTRTERAGRQAGALNDARRELAQEVAAQRGITPGQAEVYVIKPDDVVARAAGKKRHNAEVEAVLDTVPAEMLQKFDTGTEEENA